MSEPLLHLPTGIDKLTGAETGSGWTLCWNEACLAAYSRDSGWIDLGGLKGSVSFAQPTPSGILLLSGETGMAGFWRYGDRAWSWWESIPLLRDLSNVHCAGSYLVLFRPDYPVNRFRLFSVANELAEIGDVWGAEYGELIGANLDEAGRLILTCGQGIYLVRMESQSPSLEPIVSREIETDLLYNTVAFPAPDSIYIARLLEPSIRIDTATGELTDTGLGHIPGCGSLWRALCANRREKIPFLLELLKFVPRANGIFDDEVLALSFDGQTTGTVATPAGILDLDVAVSCSNCGQANPVTSVSCLGCQHPVTNGSAPDPLPESAATHYQAQVLSWSLLLDPDRHMQAALDQLLESVGYSTEVLARSIAKNIGIVACQELVERARKLDIDRMYSHSLEGAQCLFGHIGPQAADVVRRCLNDLNPSVVALGCAAAAARERSDPLMWDVDHPIPTCELVELLGHEHESIRNLAAKACGVLRIEESEQQLTGLLSDANWLVRLTAAEALSELPSLDAATRAALGRRAIEDTDDSVRESAVEAVGKHAGDSDSVDTLITALCDLDGDPRSSAGEAVAGCAASLSAMQFLRVVDIATLLMMTADLANDPSDYTIWIDDLILKIVQGLAEPAEDIEGLARMAPELQQIFYRSAVLALFPAPRADGMPIDDEGEVEEVRAVLDQLAPGELLIDLDYERLLESPGDPPSFDLAARIFPTDAELGSRLAVIAVFAHRGDPFVDDVAASAEYDVEGYRPLHLRLKSETTTPGASVLCRSIVERQALERGVAGIAALYALASAGDHRALGQLTDRILSGELERCDVVMSSLLTLTDSTRRPELLSRLLAADGIPLRSRLALYEEWEWNQNLELSVHERRPLLLEMIGETELPQSDRLKAARELADIGEPGHLEQCWSESDPQTLDPDNLYEFSRDMAMAGHGEYLDNVRGEWIERGDLEALKAFVAVGTQEDLAELEKALELKAPEKMIRDTMAAIRSRSADD